MSACACEAEDHGDDFPRAYRLGRRDRPRKHHPFEHSWLSWSAPDRSGAKYIREKESGAAPPSNREGLFNGGNHIDLGAEHEIQTLWLTYKRPPFPITPSEFARLGERSRCLRYLAKSLDSDIDAYFDFRVGFSKAMCTRSNLISRATRSPGREPHLGIDETMPQEPGRSRIICSSSGSRSVFVNIHESPPARSSGRGSNRSDI